MFFLQIKLCIRIRQLPHSIHMICKGFWYTNVFVRNSSFFPMCVSCLAGPSVRICQMFSWMIDPLSSELAAVRQSWLLFAYATLLWKSQLLFRSHSPHDTAGKCGGTSTSKKLEEGDGREPLGQVDNQTIPKIAKTIHISEKLIGEIFRTISDGQF